MASGLNALRSLRRGTEDNRCPRSIAPLQEQALVPLQNNSMANVEGRQPMADVIKGG